jgi:hypothetical protein
MNEITSFFLEASRVDGARELREEGGQSLIEKKNINLEARDPNPRMEVLQTSPARPPPHAARVVPGSEVVVAGFPVAFFSREFIYALCPDWTSLPRRRPRPNKYPYSAEPGTARRIRNSLGLSKKVDELDWSAFHRP